MVTRGCAWWATNAPSNAADCPQGHSRPSRLRRGCSRVGESPPPAERSICVVQTWFNPEQIRADLNEPEPLWQAASAPDRRAYGDLRNRRSEVRILSGALREAPHIWLPLDPAVDVNEDSWDEHPLTGERGTPMAECCVHDMSSPRSLAQTRGPAAADDPRRRTFDQPHLRLGDRRRLPLLIGVKARRLRRARSADQSVG